MPLTPRVRQSYRADEKQGHKLLTDKERKKLIAATLPAPNEVQTRNPSAARRSHLGVRRFLRSQLFVLVFAIMHGIFSLYIRVRQIWNVVCFQFASVLYYHHGTPEYVKRDVVGLPRKPKHLSVILKAEGGHRARVGLDRLIDQAAEVATWCACAEIPMLSIYEKTGILKKHIPRVHDAVVNKFTFYYGGAHPSLSITSPHKDEYSLSDVAGEQGHLRLHLISDQDGRDSMVDLTRTLAEMSQRGKLSPQDISQDLVDAELSEGIMSEPDLLISFTPHLNLAGYPPWQIRLTEIFCLRDNEAFGYQVFVKALRKYAGAQMRQGR